MGFIWLKETQKLVDEALIIENNEECVQLIANFFKNIMWEEE